MSEWISTNDVLPEDGRLVLISVFNAMTSYVTIGYFDHDSEYWKPAADTLVSKPVTVEAWMPLPAPLRKRI